MQLSVQGSSPTFDIGDLLFEMVAAIQDQVIFSFGDFFETGTQGLFVREI